MRCTYQKLHITEITVKIIEISNFKTCTLVLLALSAYMSPCHSPDMDPVLLVQQASIAPSEEGQQAPEVSPNTAQPADIRLRRVPE